MNYGNRLQDKKWMVTTVGGEMLFSQQGSVDAASKEASKAEGN